jgi:hypothetical protein
MANVMNQPTALIPDKNRRRLIARPALVALLCIGGLSTGAITAVADAPISFQSVHTSRAIGSWTLGGGGQLTIDLIANRTQTTPDPPTRTRAVLVSGSQSFCDQVADQWVSRTFDAFQTVDPQALHFERLDAARVDAWIVVSTSDLRLPSCAAPDSSQAISTTGSISIHISATWSGTGGIVGSRQDCLPAVCFTVSRFRFATVAGSLASDAPEMNMSLDSPTIAGLSTFTMFQHSPVPGGEALDKRAGSTESTDSGD